MYQNIFQSVTYVLTVKTDLSKVGKTEVELSFKVDGLSKVGKERIKINVIKPVEN